MKHKDVKLPGGYTLIIERGGLRIGQTVIDLRRPPLRRDIDAIKNVFIMGAAANSSHVAQAFNGLLSAIQSPVQIIEGMRGKP